MSRIANKIMFMASIIRIAAAIVIAGVVAYGIYTLISNSIVTGLLWIAGAVACGIFGHILFGLLTLITVAMTGSPTQGANGTSASIRTRGNSSGLSARRLR